MADRITDMLKEIGIGTEVTKVPDESYFKDHIAAGEYDLALYSWPASAFPATDARPIYAKPVPAADGSLNVAQNYTRVGTDQVDQLFDRAMATLDEKEALYVDDEPWFGTLTTRNNGSLVADRSGAVTAFAMTNLQERGVLFTDPGTEVYEGMIVGENSRADDMDVNITKEKKLTNMRSSSADSFEAIVPPRKLSLEQSLEFCRDDECVEVTPEAVRIRKVNLDARERARAASRAKHG
ncbi:hypothetical protein STENM327S_07440 [Streptomyces tendae]